MMQIWAMLFFLVAALLNSATILSACNPEPGPQHFPVLQAPPPRITSGYFSVYNGLNGLPCNDIRSILVFDTNSGKKYVIVGTADHGLMIFSDETWHTSGSGLFQFPELTVTAMIRLGDDSFLAGTPAGIFKGTIETDRITFEPVAASRKEAMNVTALARNPDEANSFLVACDRTAGILSNETFLEFRIPEHLSPTGFSAVTTSDFGSFAGCNGGIYQITGDGLHPCQGEIEQTGWITSFAAAKERLFIASSNGVSLLKPEGKMESLLPGVWATCLAFSATPEETLSGNDFKSFVAAPQSATVLPEEDPLEELRGIYNQLQLEYAEYTRRYSGQTQADPSAVNAMYDKFFAFEAASQQAIANGGALISPLLKGLWIGTQDSGLVLFSTNGQRYHLTTENSKLPSDHVTAIACGPDGETWVGTANAGIMRYSSRPIGGKGKLNTLLSCRPTRIKVIADMLLIGTENDGLYIFDIKTMQETGHYAFKGFHRQVSDFAIDREGDLWVTGDAGVMVWNGKTWGKIPFAANAIIPTAMASRIAIDSQNRIFIAYAEPVMVCEQVCIYNGSFLERTDPATVLRLLQASGTSRLESFQLHGLAGTYLRNFDVGNASAALAAFENGEPGQVTAMLNTEHYLLTGLESGLQKIFDGEGYKQLSELGTGRIGAIRNFFRLPSGIIVIQGIEGISEFDGQHYRLIESPSTGPGFKITDMCPDQLNPETYRISFSGAGGGGYARYQGNFWEKFNVRKPVISLAQADRIIFLATPESVDYLIE